MQLAKVAFLCSALGRWVSCNKRNIKMWVHIDGTDSMYTFRNKNKGSIKEDLFDPMEKVASDFDYGVSFFGDRTSPSVKNFDDGDVDLGDCKIRKYYELWFKMRDMSYNFGGDDEEDALSALPYLATNKFGSPAGNNDLHLMVIITDYPPKYNNDTYNVPEHNGGNKRVSWDVNNRDYFKYDARGYEFYTLDQIFDPLKKRGIVPITVTIDGPNSRTTGSAYDAMRHILTQVGLSPDEGKSFTLRASTQDTNEIPKMLNDLVKKLNCWVPDPATPSTTTTTRTTTTTTTTTTKPTTTTRRTTTSTTTTTTTTTTTKSTTTGSTSSAITTSSTSSTTTTTSSQTTVPCTSTTLKNTSDTTEQPSNKKTKIVVASAISGLAAVGVISGLVWARRPTPSLSAEMSDMYEDEEDGEYTLREAAVDMDEEAFA